MRLGDREGGKILFKCVCVFVRVRKTLTEVGRESMCESVNRPIETKEERNVFPYRVI